MKSVFSILVVLALSITTYAQEREDVNAVDFIKKTTEIKLPAVVIKRMGEDFSVYIPEIENQDGKISYIQNKFIAYDLGKNAQGYDEYLVTLTIKNASLVATYNEKGKLTQVIEKYKNVRMPNEMVTKILTQYPGWKIIKNQYSYSQENGNIKKKQYDVILGKDNDVKKIAFDSKGEMMMKK